MFSYFSGVSIADSTDTLVVEMKILQLFSQGFFLCQSSQTNFLQYLMRSSTL